ncbi:MAG: hypothetical protein IT204_04700 [Fimbriimonadaceae bacterium]|nr:hypothetical protein [Fimbriimonadaceae bacterium]
MRGSGRRWGSVLVALLPLLVGPSAVAVTVSLNADRKQVPADGLSEITITATIRDGGGLVGGGYTVQFAATQGSLSVIGAGTAPSQFLEVPVSGGFAKCLLRSTTFETTSVVTAFLVGDRGSQSDRLEVSFGSLSGPSRTFDNILRVKGDYIWYGPEPSYQIMDVIGKASVSYQGVEVHANRIQIDLQEYLLLAKDLAEGVTLATGPPPYDTAHFNDGSKAPYRGEALVMDLRTHTGAIYSAQLGETIQFTGRALTRQADRPPTPGMFDLFELGEAKIWIEAKAALVYPYEKIRFDRAKFFVNGLKVFSLPYYFEGLGYNAQLGPALSQVVNYSTRDGWIVNFPYYFDVGDRHTNELRLTRGVRTGMFGRTSGFQMAYAHHAELKGDKGDFDFVIDELFSRPGVQYNRQQRFGPATFGTLALAWPRHDNFYSSTTLYTPAGPGNISMNANVDHLNGFSNFDSGISANANVVWQSNPVRLAALDGSFSGSLGFTYSHSLSDQNYYRQSAALSFSRNPWRIGSGGTIQPYLGLRFQNTVNGDREVAFTFNTSWRQQVSRTMSLSLGYTFDKYWNSSFNIPERHMLTTSWQLYREGLWTGYAYGTWNLQDNALSASALVDYSLTRHWGLAGQTLYQSSSAGSYAETEFWVYRLIGARELRLRYSLERGRLFFEVDNSF